MKKKGPALWLRNIWALAYFLLAAFCLPLADQASPTALWWSFPHAEHKSLATTSDICSYIPLWISNCDPHIYIQHSADLITLQVPAPSCSCSAPGVGAHLLRAGAVTDGQHGWRQMPCSYITLLSAPVALPGGTSALCWQLRGLNHGEVGSGPQSKAREVQWPGVQGGKGPVLTDTWTVHSPQGWGTSFKSRTKDFASLCFNFKNV